MMLNNKVFFIYMTLLGFSNPTEKGDKQIISNHKFFLHFEHMYCKQMFSYISKS